jgi:small subunit ribosomal protein S19
MALKEFSYRGKTLEELQKLSLKEFVALLPARSRRSLSRGLKPEQKKLLANLKVSTKSVKTHLRNAIILPEMVGKMIFIYTGKDYTQIKIEPEMIGHYLGEFALTRKSVSHSAPGVGATKSSSAVSVR